MSENKKTPPKRKYTKRKKATVEPSVEQVAKDAEVEKLIDAVEVEPVVVEPVVEPIVTTPVVAPQRKKKKHCL